MTTLPQTTSIQLPRPMSGGAGPRWCDYCPTWAARLARLPAQQAQMTGADVVRVLRANLWFIIGSVLVGLLIGLRPELVPGPLLRPLHRYRTGRDPEQQQHYPGDKGFLAGAGYRRPEHADRRAAHAGDHSSQRTAFRAGGWATRITRFARPSGLDSSSRPTARRTSPRPKRT